MKNFILEKEMEDSVKRCIDNMKNFCGIMKLKIIGSIAVINGDPTQKKNELMKLGRKFVS